MRITPELKYQFWGNIPIVPHSSGMDFSMDQWEALVLQNDFQL